MTEMAFVWKCVTEEFKRRKVYANENVSTGRICEVVTEIELTVEL